MKITLFVCSQALQRRFAALKRVTTNTLKRYNANFVRRFSAVQRANGLQENNPVTCALGARRLTAGLASNAP